MSKITKRFKKYKKNKTIKKGGAPINEEPVKERKGIFDMIGNKISEAASSAATTLGDAGLKIMGLERINKTNEEEENIKKVDENINKISNTVLDIENVLDNTKANVLNNTNDILGSNEAKESAEIAAEKTADILRDGASIINDAFDNPEVKTEIKKTIDNVGEFGSMVIDASKKPFNKLVDVAAESTPKIIGATTAGLSKVGFDMLGAVPYLGGIIDLGRAVNDGSKALSASVEAGSEVVEATTDAISETTKNIEEGIKVFNEKRLESQEIADRTTKSMSQFENQTNESQTNEKNSQMGGRKKTRRRLLKNKVKTKRVRFSI
jgi:hypothetical protein